MAQVFNLRTKAHQTRFLDAWFDLYPGVYRKFHGELGGDGRAMIESLGENKPNRFHAVLKKALFPVGSREKLHKGEAQTMSGDMVKGMVGVTGLVVAGSVAKSVMSHL